MQRSANLMFDLVEKCYLAITRIGEGRLSDDY